jgi:hypothetical protein
LAGDWNGAAVIEASWDSERTLRKNRRGEASFPSTWGGKTFIVEAEEAKFGNTIML